MTRLRAHALWLLGIVCVLAWLVLIWEVAG